jgi:hypothetical protein
MPGWYHPFMHRALRLASVLLVVFLLGALTQIGTAAAPARVVAIADVHGAFTQFVTILQRTGLVDGKRRWSGGAATFVQIGDILDRGARARECVDLVMDLERQAEKAGGKVIPLLGNHEAMNVMHDVRYVTPEIYRTFATERSEDVRGQALQSYLEFLAAHTGHVHSILVPADDATKKKWLDEHPPGYFEYQDALGPDGKYGKWIRRHQVIAQVGDGLFVHGGLNPALPFQTVAELDAQVTKELQDFDDIWKSLVRRKIVWQYMTLREAIALLDEEAKLMQAQPKAPDPALLAEMQKLLGYRQWMAASSDGPLWYRGLTKESEPALAAGLDALLVRFGARYMVVGHTVQAKATVTAWLGNRVIAMDTGMLPEEFKGRPSALEIRDGKFTVLYGDGTTQALQAPEPLTVKSPGPPFKPQP